MRPIRNAALSFLALIAAAVIGAGACATSIPQMREKIRPTPSPQSIAQGLDSMLSDAGFVMLPADTDEKRAQLQSLVPLKVSYYVGKTGKLHYWMADPYSCHCLFHGTDQAYQRYENMKLQADTARESSLSSSRMNLAGYQQEQMDLQMEQFNPYGLGTVGPGMVF